MSNRHETDGDTAERLLKLRQKDPPATRGIERGLISLASGVQPPPAPPAESESVIEWLAGKQDPDIIIVMGTGNDNDIPTLLKHAPEKAKILVIERYEARMARLFKAFPLEEYVEKGSLRLSVGEDTAPAELHTYSIIEMPKAPSLHLLDLVGGNPDDLKFYTETMMRIRTRMRLKVFNMGTLLHLGLNWQFNTIKNLPVMMVNPGTSALKGLLKGKPAIVVAAGPSLNKSLEFVAKQADRFVIIAVGTALRPLRKAGIRPDLVVAVDASSETGPQFETQCEDLYLACTSIVFPPIPSRFRGIFGGYTDSNPVQDWAKSVGLPADPIMAGGTVTVTAIDLAEQMGCDPIITVGMDLSMTDEGTTHASNTMYQGHKHDPAKMIKVPGNYSETVLTTPQFSTYVTVANRYVETHEKTKFVNATTGGAKIEGMELIHPSGIERFAGEPVDAYPIISKAHESFVPSHTKDIPAEIRKVADEIGEIMGLSTSAAMLCNQLIMMLRSPHPDDVDIAKDMLKELKETDDRIMAARATSQMLEMSLRAGYFAVHHKQMEDEKRYTDGILANSRSRALYEQIAGAAKWTRTLLISIADEIAEKEEKGRKLSGVSNLLTEEPCKKEEANAYCN